MDLLPFNAGATPIRYAARSGHHEMVKLLIHKYKRNIQAEDHENWNALHYSCNAGQYDVTKLLMEHHVNDKIISLVEEYTTLEIAESKRWNDIIQLFNDNDDDESKEYQHSINEKQELFEKTKRRLNDCINDVHTSGSKLSLL